MKKSEIKTIKVTDISRSGNNARKINKAEPNAPAKKKVAKRKKITNKKKAKK